MNINVNNCIIHDDENNFLFCVHRKYGLSYTNPNVRTEWKYKFIPMQVANREKCRVLLYVITGKTRSLSSMVEVSQKTRSNAIVKDHW